MKVNYLILIGMCALKRSAQKDAAFERKIISNYCLECVEARREDKYESVCY